MHNALLLLVITFGFWAVAQFLAVSKLALRLQEVRFSAKRKEQRPTFRG